MKKTIFAFIFAIMFSIVLGSCNCSGTTNTTDVDSIAVDTTVVDSLIGVDSIIIADTVALEDSIVVAE